MLIMWNPKPHHLYLTVNKAFDISVEILALYIQCKHKTAVSTLLSHKKHLLFFNLWLFLKFEVCHLPLQALMFNLC